jgi:molybdopterin-binding protein
MAQYRIGQVAELLAVSPDTARRWVDSGKLATVRTEAGHRLVEGSELARFLAARPQPPRQPIGDQSARNRFSGVVTRVLKDGVMAQVELQAGPHRVVSLISREAAEDLGLEPGVRAIASVKSTNVIVELPASDT